MPANLEIRLNLNEELKIKTFSKLYLFSSPANLMESNIPSFFFLVNYLIDIGSLI